MKQSDRKSMRQKYKDGEITQIDYQNWLAQQKGFKSYIDYRDWYAQQKGFKNRIELQNNKIQQRGFKNKTDYLNKLAQQKGFKNNTEYSTMLHQKRGFVTEKDYSEYLIKKNGFENQKEYQNLLAQQKGFKDIAEYNRHNAHQAGRAKPMEENKECALYLGVHIAERVLSKIFGMVQRMPILNVGYDFKCPKGYKIDVKSSCLYNAKGRGENRYKVWHFGIKKNIIADYFLLLAFDDRTNLNPIHIWLIKGNETEYQVFDRKQKKSLNSVNSLSILLTQRSIEFYKKFEQLDKLERTKECCEQLKNNGEEGVK